MLQLEHQQNKYKPVSFTPNERSQPDDTRIHRRLGAIFGEKLPSGVGHDLGDSREESAEQLLEEFIETRDQLVYRKLRREALSIREESRLAALNILVDEVLPRPEPLPNDARAAIAQARLLGARRPNGGR